MVSFVKFNIIYRFVLCLEIICTKTTSNIFIWCFRTDIFIYHVSFCRAMIIIFRILHKFDEQESETAGSYVCCCCSYWYSETLVSELQPLMGLLFIPQMIYQYGEPQCNDINKENWRTQSKTCPTATLSTINPTWTDPGMNLGLHGERPETNHLSHDTAGSFVCPGLVSVCRKVTYLDLMLKYKFWPSLSHSADLEKSESKIILHY
jgi:hypothetical protein